ncbi:MAG: DUF938 domain-containing protein [Pseudomonadota bacterium]
MVALAVSVVPTVLRSSPSCERNGVAVASVLADWLGGREQLLEVGSGTGQHAARCIGEHPALRWYVSDHQPDAETIRGWAARSTAADRIIGPAQLDVNEAPQWKAVAGFDVCFTANTLHIMPWSAGQAMFMNAARYAADDCLLVIYGPFHVHGEATSEGNARFDAALRADAAHMGIRDIEAVRAEAANHGWLEQAHYHMPANNQMLLFALNRGAH